MVVKVVIPGDSIPYDIEWEVIGVYGKVDF
jgi:hypothetical protein